MRNQPLAALCHPHAAPTPAGARRMTVPYVRSSTCFKHLHRTIGTSQRAVRGSVSCLGITSSEINDSSLHADFFQRSLLFSVQSAQSGWGALGAVTGRSNSRSLAVPSTGAVVFQTAACEGTKKPHTGGNCGTCSSPCPLNHFSIWSLHYRDAVWS